MRKASFVSSIEELRGFTGTYGLPVLLIPWGENFEKPSQMCRSGDELERGLEQALRDSVYEPRVHVIFDPRF